jgi:hypothetical protein
MILPFWAIFFDDFGPFLEVWWRVTEKDFKKSQDDSTS